MASIRTLANQLGSSPATLGFAVMTGIGDCLGVSTGHLLFNLIKKNLGFKVSMTNEVKVAAWLGTASFMSGSIWQPTVNMCAALGLGFASSAVLTGTVCGLTFFLGLRMGRHVYSKLIGHIEAPNSKNMTQDAGLCVGIAGAAGMFVSTDVSFIGNPLKSTFGVYETTAPLTGMIKAGGSTAAGFFGTHCLSYLGLAATRKH